MISNNLKIVPNLVESLPAGQVYWGARAVSTPKGPFILLSKTPYSIGVLYLLDCNGNTCSWQKQAQQLDDGKDSVMVVLRDGYSC